MNERRRSAGEREEMGVRCDGIMRELSSNQEFAACEEAKDGVGKKSSKYLAESTLKLPKVMHDMLHQKVKTYDLEAVRTSQLEIIGLFHSGKFF